ncbi:MAG: HAD family hydrolase [Lachnospiraceae bacterium]|nr:HAD family hydrolase [Lachnospiraceae bacterium]
MKIKGAIFDMDGTLVDSLMLWDILWEEFGTRYRSGACFRPDPQTEKMIRTLPLYQAMELLHERCEIGKSAEELTRVTTQVFEEFYASKVKQKEGVREVLDYCYENGVKMCIASATDPKLIRIALAHCGLEKYFSQLFSCSEIGKGKDDPELYLNALRYLGTPLEETWVFEDSYVAIHTAVQTGMPTVGIYDDYNSDQERIRDEATIYVAKGENLWKKWSAQI